LPARPFGRRSRMPGPNWKSCWRVRPSNSGRPNARSKKAAGIHSRTSAMPWKLDVAGEFYRGWDDLPFIVQESILDHLEDVARRPRSYAEAQRLIAGAWFATRFFFRNEGELWGFFVPFKLQVATHSLFTPDLVVIATPP